METYCATVVEFARALGTADVRSRGMTAWKDYLGAYIESARFAAIRGEADALREALSSVRVCLFIRHGAVRVKKYEGEAEYGDEIERMFGRLARKAPARTILAQFTDSRDLNRVEADILDRVANLYPDVFGGEVGEFRSRNASYADPGVVAFDREIQFYVSYLDYIAPIRRSGSAFCYPKVSRASKELRSRGRLRHRPREQARPEGRGAGAERFLSRRGRADTGRDGTRPGRQDDLRPSLRPTALPSAPRPARARGARRGSCSAIKY